MTLETKVKMQLSKLKNAILTKRNIATDSNIKYQRIEFERRETLINKIVKENKNIFEVY